MKIKRTFPPHVRLAVQTASLSLTTTPSEDIALALRSLLWPLAWLGLPVQRVTLTVLLALRFLALVLEEGRNLALGLAMRGIDWKAMGPGSGLTVMITAWGSFSCQEQALTCSAAAVSHDQSLVACHWRQPQKRQRQTYIPKAWHNARGPSWVDIGLHGARSCSKLLGMLGHAGHAPPSGVSRGGR